MQPLLTAQESRALDGRAIAAGLPEMVLMEHAALAVVARLRARFGAGLPQSRGTILAGHGNNGADAFAAARLLWNQGIRDFKIQAIPGAHAQRAVFEHLLGAKVSAAYLGAPEESTASVDWILDGLFGTGLSRAITGEPAAWIEFANRAGAWTVAIDIPSGLSADTGHALGPTIVAAETVTFGSLKRGLFTGDAQAYVGTVHFAPIQIPRAWLPTDAPVQLYEAHDAHPAPRGPTSHKGSFGHVLLIGGHPGQEGALAIAAHGALRAGAGLVSFASPSPQARLLLPPEAMQVTWPDVAAAAASGKYTSIAVGPGLGTGDDAKAVVTALRLLNAPIVFDADALNLLAHDPSARVPASAVLTPHPKEAARLLGTDTATIQTDRYAAARALTKRRGGWVVLKGNGTLVQAPTGGPTWVVPRGDASLAKGGTGDLLTGILAALLGTERSVKDAIPLAVFLHGLAAEIATQRFGTTRSATASDIAELVPAAFSALVNR